jgi:predicted esterase
MTGNTYSKSVAPYIFRQGTIANSPILLPLTGKDGGERVMISFCRRIRHGASLLIPNLTLLTEQARSEGSRLRNTLADRLAALIRGAVHAEGLSLIPIIVVGHAEGADLGAHLMLRHGSLVDACILLHPVAEINALKPCALDGIYVLLAHSGSKHAVGTVGRQVGDVISKAGAEVVRERVPAHRFPGVRDAAIARVFITVLFGA